MILEAKVTQAWVIIRAASKWPMEFSLILTNWQVVDARMADGHQPVVIEFPVFVAV